MRVVLAVVVMLFGVGCEKVCTPGKAEACVGPGGCAGGQTCNAEGTAFGVCDCGSTGGGTGGGGGGTTGGGGGVTGGGGGGSTGGGGGGVTGGGGGGTTDGGELDGGADAGSPDAGPCDPAPADGGSTGCAAGQRCTWLALTGSTGRIGCVPNGSAPLNGACTAATPGVNGFDDCVAGSVCINAKCTRVCSVGDVFSCPGDDSCVAYDGLFADAGDAPTVGACVEGCNPLTQLTSSGASCGSNKGCYLLLSSSTSAVCAPAGTTQHNVVISGSVFANSCVPGAIARRVFGTGNFECGGLCSPAEVTSTMNQADEGGVGANSCQTRWGASAPSTAATGESCRYLWALEQAPGPGKFSNTLGFCFKHAAAQYDSDGDSTPDAPFPRCTALTTGDVLAPMGPGADNDALFFWCAPLPQMKVASPAPRIAGPLPRLTGWR